MLQLSIVIPVYNESHRIQTTISRIVGFIQNVPFDVEVIVVDDGSADNTIDVIEKMRRREITVLRSTHHLGPGAAVRHGVEHASGNVILVMDADYPTPMAEVLPMMELVEDGVDIVLGSRRKSSSRIAHAQPFTRRVTGWLYRNMVRWVLRVPWGDTQCGFKLFERSVAKRIFSEGRINSFAYYVELVLRARRYGFQINEHPVEWSHREGSRVSIVRDGWAMFWDTIRLWPIR